VPGVAISLEAAMKQKSLWARLLYRARDLRSRALFEALARHCRGDVLDVGGWDFVLTARRYGVSFDHWTTLESSHERRLDLDEANVRVVLGDGCAMEFGDASFDTVLSIQVLEHVFEPIRMVEEVARVLRRGGHAVLLIPQTSTTHLAPDYHYNFSRYWIAEVMRRTGLEIVEHRTLGGFWSSMASHLVYFFPQVLRLPSNSDPAIRRSPLFWPLLPLMAAFAVLLLPICLLFSLGDLAEEPNNHLVVARKPT